MNTVSDCATGKLGRMVCVIGDSVNGNKVIFAGGTETSAKGCLGAVRRIYGKDSRVQMNEVLVT